MKILHSIFVLILITLLSAKVLGQNRDSISKRQNNRRFDFDLELSTSQKIRMDSINNQLRLTIAAIPAGINLTDRKRAIDDAVKVYLLELKRILKHRQYKFYLAQQSDAAIIFNRRQLLFSERVNSKLAKP